MTFEIWVRVVSGHSSQNRDKLTAKANKMYKSNLCWYARFIRDVDKVIFFFSRPGPIEQNGYTHTVNGKKKASIGRPFEDMNKK